MHRTSAICQSVHFQVHFTGGFLKACPEICVSEKVANYCQAILKPEDLCPLGQKCCISRDASEDVPFNVIIPNKNGSLTNRPVTTTESTKTSFPSKHVIMKEIPCAGECLNGFFVIFCDHIDMEAYCPGEGSCCITQVGHVVFGSDATPIAGYRIARLLIQCQPK